MGKILRIAWDKLKSSRILCFFFSFTVGMGIICIIMVYNDVGPKELVPGLAIGAIVSAFISGMISWGGDD